MKIQFHRIDTNVVIGLLVREFCCSGTDVSAKVLAMYADTRTPSMEPQWLAAGLSQHKRSLNSNDGWNSIGCNSDILAKECAKGAKEAGHDVELLSLKGKDIKYCIGCLSCQKTGMCVLKDDVADIMAKVKDAEVIVYATPIYYYEMCGQMKTLLDRLNPLYSTDYSFRDIYMIATAAENDESAFEKAYNGLQGWVDCFEKASLKGMVGGGGIGNANTAADHLEVMKKAYELGKEL